MDKRVGGPLYKRHHQGHVIYADWSMVHRHGTDMSQIERGHIDIDTTLDYTLDDSDGEIEFWCQTCNKDVTDLFEDFEFDFL